LTNPLKRVIILRVYDAKDGLNVGILADEMQQKGLCMAGVSQYLRQFEQMGLIKRYRAGRHVNYVGNANAANPTVRKAFELIRDRMKKDDGVCERVFGVLRNPFRASVVAALSQGRRLSAAEICDKTGHNPKLLKRDLKEALDEGIVDTDGDSFWYVEPADSVLAQLVGML